MSTSAAQVRANRINAGRSTGPKTEEGKARSSSNSITHGFYSDVAVLPGEDAAAYNALREELADHYQPAGPLETELAERLALTLWKIRRMEALETRLLSDSTQTAPDLTALNRLSLMRARLDRAARDIKEDIRVEQKARAARVRRDESAAYFRAAREQYDYVLQVPETKELGENGFVSHAGAEDSAAGADPRVNQPWERPDVL